MSDRAVTESWEAGRSANLRIGRLTRENGERPMARTVFGVTQIVWLSKTDSQRVG